MAMSENCKRIFNYVKEATANGEQIIAADVAEALGLPKKTVDTTFTSGIQRKGLGIRVPGEIELEDGTHDKAKFLQLTESGMNFDPEAAQEN